MSRSLASLVALVSSLVGDPATSQILVSKLLPNDPKHEARFGVSVSFDGEAAFIGAHFADAPGVPAAGAVYVFERDGVLWTQTQKLTASDAGYSDIFGVDVAHEGDLAVVSARYDKDNGPRSGSAYVFRREPSGWIEEAKLLPSDGQAGAEFGVCVAVSGDLVAVGPSSFTSSPPPGFGGAVYLFERQSPGVWVEVQKLVGSLSVTGSGFGHSVDFVGDQLLVSQPGISQQPGSGLTYIFQKQGAAWSEASVLQPGDLGASDFFGSVLHHDEERLLLSAHKQDGGTTDTGAVYAYQLNGGAWIQDQKLTASDAQAGDFLGGWGSLLGDHLFLSSIGNDQSGANAP